MDTAVPTDGSLGDHELAEVVADVCLRRFTGALTAAADGALVSLQWREGVLVGATSSHPDDTLADFLLRRGRITLRRHRETIAGLREGQSFALALLEAGALTPEELALAEEDLAEEVLGRAFGWIEGSYRLQGGGGTAPTRPLRRSTASLILAALHHLDSWPRVSRGVGGALARYVRTERYEDLIPELAMSFERLSVLLDLHGVKDVITICEDSSLPDFEVCRVLWAYRAIGAVRRVEPLKEVLRGLEDEGLADVLDEEAPGQVRPPAPPAPAPAAAPGPVAPVPAIALPAPATDAIAAEPELEEVPEDVPEDDQRKRVLLVALPADLSARVEPMLSRSCFAVQRAGGAAEAVARCTDRRFDLVLTSDPPPDMPLAELLTALRTRQGAAHVVVAAEAANVAALRRSLGQGAELAVLLNDPKALLEEVASRLLGVARRVSARLMVRLEVRAEKTRRLVMYQTENLSTVGMLVRTNELMPIGTTVNLELMIPEDRNPVLAQGQVMRHTAADLENVQGMGLRFMTFRGDSQKRLEDFLAATGSRGRPGIS